jgi:hypothetical protein
MFLIWCAELPPCLVSRCAHQAYGEFQYDRIDEKERSEIIRNACPGPGACGGMYTANTMATAAEALGMALPVRRLLLCDRCVLLGHWSLCVEVGSPVCADPPFDVCGLMDGVLIDVRYVV